MPRAPRLRRLLVALLLTLSTELNSGVLDPVPERPARVVNKLPRDPTLFTQGLFFRHARFYHSGGMYGQSRLVVSQPGTAQTQITRQLSRAWFAEGIAQLDDVLYLLTWREGLAAVFSLDGLSPLKQLRYDGEGWGLTSDGRELIMSNGSDQLVWRNPVDFRITRRLNVRVGAVPVRRLNELEWVHEQIYANIWHTDYIVCIDPNNGQVLFKSKLNNLLTEQERTRSDVLNGIAWDAENERLFVTGKYWPWIFEVELLEQHDP